MAKVIFLDIDGVLNIMSESYRTTNIMRRGAMIYIEPHLAERLDYIIQKTGAMIVVSSSWRGDMDDLQKQMERAGFKNWNKVIGRTPYIHGGRGLEIQAWLAHHTGVTKYVVLEDEIDDVCGEKCDAVPRSNVVEVDMQSGLSHYDTEDILYMFGVKEGVSKKTKENARTAISLAIAKGTLGGIGMGIRNLMNEVEHGDMSSVDATRRIVSMIEEVVLKIEEAEENGAIQ